MNYTVISIRRTTPLAAQATETMIGGDLHVWNIPPWVGIGIEGAIAGATKAVVVTAGGMPAGDTKQSRWLVVPVGWDALGGGGRISSWVLWRPRGSGLSVFICGVGREKNFVGKPGEGR